MSGSGTRDSSIDALKGFGILCIILTHAQGAFLPGAAGKLAVFGARFVQLFFILNGFLIFRGTERFSADRDAARTKKWAIAHALALFPVYYAALLAAYVIYGGEGYAYWLGGRTVSAGNVAAHISGLFGLHPYWCNSLIGVEWYLGNLLLFYLLVPLIRHRIRDLRSAATALAGSAALCLACTAALKLFFAERVAENAVTEAYALNFCIVNQLPVFLLGAFLHYLIPKLEENPDAKKRALPGAISLAAGVSGTAVLMFRGSGPVPVALASGAVFGLLFAAVRLLSGLIKILKSPVVLSRIGRASYGIYLFHFLLLQLFRRQDMLQGDTPAMLCLRYLAALAGSFGLAVLADRFLTRPVKNRLNIMIRYQDQ